MIDNAIHTGWKFIVVFEDEETGAIEGTLVEAADRAECEVLVEDEMEYQRLHGYAPWRQKLLSCVNCLGGILSICDACNGCVGILSTFKRGRGAEMMSTQSYLRAAS
jgi:hypothetical protein